MLKRERRHCQGRAFTLLWLVMWFLVACGGRLAEVTSLTPATAQGEVAKVDLAATITLPPPPTTVPATATATATPKPTFTPTPTPTPRPAVRLAAPADWEPVVLAAVAALEEHGTAWNWQLSIGVGDVALVPGGEGVPGGQRPLALAVPFTTAWEQISLADAEHVLANGHAVARPVEWALLSPNQKALRVNGLLPTDPGYPLQQPWSLISGAGFQQAAAELGPAIQQALAEEPLVHLVAVGDVMLDRTLGAFIAQGNLTYPFAHVAASFRAADVTVANLECALGDIGEPAAKSYTFRAPPAAAQALALAGVDVVSLANNHGMDYGAEALLQATELLKAAGVAPIGAGADEVAARSPHFREINGLRLAFLGYVHVPVENTGFDTAAWTAGPGTAGLAWGQPSLIAQDVAAARAAADHVIVVLHSGYEYVDAPSPEQLEAARAAVEAGATLVIGHHAHVLQGVEFGQTGVIVYGLGNFAFTIDGPPETALLNVWLDRRGVRQIEFVPAIVQVGGQPRLATPEEAAAIRQRIYRLTAILNPR